MSRDSQELYYPVPRTRILSRSRCCDLKSAYSIPGLVPAVSNMGLHLKLEQQQTLATNQYPLSSMAAAAAAAAAANLAHNQVQVYIILLN